MAAGTLQKSISQGKQIGCIGPIVGHEISESPDALVAATQKTVPKSHGLAPANRPNSGISNDSKASLCHFESPPESDTPSEVGQVKVAIEFPIPASGAGGSGRTFDRQR